MNGEKFDNCYGYYHSDDEGCKLCDSLNACRRITWVEEERNRLNCFGGWNELDPNCWFCSDSGLCENMKGRKEDG